MLVGASTSQYLIKLKERNVYPYVSVFVILGENWHYSYKTLPWDGKMLRDNEIFYKKKKRNKKKQKQQQQKETNKKYTKKQTNEKDKQKKQKQKIKNSVCANTLSGAKMLTF